MNRFNINLNHRFPTKKTILKTVKELMLFLLRKKIGKKRRKNTSATDTRMKRLTARASCRERTGARQGRLTVDDARAGRHESRGGSSDTHTRSHAYTHAYTHRQDVRPAAAPVREQTSALAHRRRGSGHQVVIIIVVAVAAVVLRE